MDVLAERLKDKDPEKRRGALAMLRQNGAKSIGLLPQVIAAMKDPDDQVRDEAASDVAGIAYCAPDEAIPQLVCALEDAEIRDRIKAALEGIGTPGQAALAEWRRNGGR